MTADDNVELEEHDSEELEDDVEDAAELEDADLEDDDEEEDTSLDDEEETDQAALEELLAQKAAARRTSAGTDEDSDIMALVSQDDDPVVVDIPVRAAPIKSDAEFVCNRCYLVKPRVQLADEARGLCRDCV